MATATIATIRTAPEAMITITTTLTTSSSSSAKTGTRWTGMIIVAAISITPMAAMTVVTTR